MPQDINQMRQEYFKQRRSDVNQQATAARQEGEDMLTRRFATMGGTGSGAAIAAMQKNREMANENLRKGNQDVAAQELQVQEGDMGREFQASETQKAREDAQRARDFQGGLAGQDLAFKREAFGKENENKLAELDLARKQFELDKDTTEFNKRMAEAGGGGGGGGGGLFGTGQGSLVGGVLDTGKKIITGDLGGAVNSAVDTVTDVVSGGTWICTKVASVHKLSKEQHEALKKFRIYAKEAYPEVTDFYINHCKDLMEKMDKVVDWKDFAPFVTDITDLVMGGDMQTAAILYMDKLFNLIAQYWPECKHPFWLKVEQNAA